MVNVQDDGSLSWDANLTTEGFQDGIKAIINGYHQASQKAVESAQQQNDALSTVGAPLQQALKGVDSSVSELVQNLRKLGADPALETLIVKYGELMKQEISFKEQLSKAVDATQISQLNNQLDQTKSQMKEVTDQVIALQKASASSPTATVPDVSKIIGTDVLNELKQSFGDIDQTTQKFIQDMIELEIRLQKLQVAQADLSKAYAEGKVSENDYATTSAYMVAETKKITDETQKLTENQKAYEASLKGTSGSITEKKQELKALQDAYNNLGEATKNSAKGQELSQKINSLSDEIKHLDTAKESVTTIRTELLKLQELMARNPDSPFFDKWKEKATELQVEITRVKKEIKEGLNPTAGLEAFTSGLRGIIGGFEAATGVIGLMTDNTEEYEKITKDAASALALMNGIQEISNVVAKTGELNVYLLGLMHKKNAEATAIDTVATEAGTAASEANAAAVEIQATATEGAAIAQKGLAAAMLANPAAVVVAAIAAIATAYLVLRNRANETKDATELLDEANKKVTDSYAERMAKVLPLVEAVKEGNISEQKSIQIHDQLAAIDEKLVDGLNRKSLAYNALKVNVDKYADSLRVQYRLEANSSAIQSSIKIEEDIAKQLQAAQQVYEKMNKAISGQKINQGTSSLISTRDKAKKDIADLTEELKEQKAATNELVQGNVELSNSTDEANKKILKTPEYYDKEIAALKTLQSSLSETSQQYKDYQKQIDALQKAKDAITGTTKTRSTEESAYNKLLREQQSLLQTIDSLKRGAKQSGLIQEESELDKINEKYDNVIKKVEQYNKKAPKKLQIDVASLNDARATELQNAEFRKNAENYKKSLDVQKGYFEEYEKAKLDFGEEKAKQLFSVQIKGADSYLEYLKQQKAEIEKSVPDGSKPNFQQALELQALSTQIINETNRMAKESLDKQLDNLKTLIKATVTFNEQKLAINKKYDALEKTALADKTASPEETAKRLSVIKQLRETDIEDLQNNMARQSDLYKKLNQDIISFTRQQIKERIKLLQDVLKNGTTLTPVMKADIKSTVDQLHKLLAETDPATKTFEDIEKYANAASDAFRSIANDIRETNPGLSKFLTTISDIADTASNAAGAIADFQSGDVVGAIGKVVKVFEKVIKLFTGGKASARAAAQEMLSYQQQLVIGQVDYNELIRKQALGQKDVNSLTLQELETKKELLKVQKQQAQQDYNALLAQIQLYGKQITGQHTEKYGGFLGINRKTRVVQDLAGISDADYVKLQQLFIENKLDASTAAWFQELQKVHDELDAIGQSAQDVIDAQNQQATGTTASSIADSIIQGFEQGKKATADFADDFQNLMKQAILNSLKAQALEVPLKRFYEEFAASAESDGVLTSAEISSLKDSYNATISAAAKQFEELQKITDVNFNNASSSQNSLSGAIQGITEKQAELLAGQFGGLRLTAFDQLNVAKSSLDALNKIVNYTALLVSVEANIRSMKTLGVKIQ